MKTPILLAAMGVASLSGPASAQSPLWGIARAGDGDSLMVGETKVRLFGIDAPESNQSCKRNGQEWPCGAAAAEELAKLVTGKQVRCTWIGTDQHGRMLGRCSVGTLNVNRAMVASGHAVAFRRYSTDYVSAKTARERTGGVCGRAHSRCPVNIGMPRRRRPDDPPAVRSANRCERRWWQPPAPPKEAPDASW